MPSERAAQTLREVFGFEQFRPGQQPVIAALLEGRSALAMFPTGAGKSLCYQLPALLLEGLTIVVSPLIALMKDQLDFLARKSIPAPRLDSTLSWDEVRKTHLAIRAGALKLLYLAPERLANERLLAVLRRVPIGLLAIDEAHCISEWGHNFRPDYLRLAALARQLKVGRVLALTATATGAVAADIARAFGIDSAQIINTGSYRPNLELRSTPVNGDRDGLLLARLGSRPRGPTVIYVTLQRTAERIAELLNAHGIAARAYHAGLEADQRTQIQEWFMAADDAVVAATIAFGMGIDKANIRYIYHYNLPKTLENYAQEVGRAGRDGQKAICEILADPADAVILENFAYGDTPASPAITAILDHLYSQGAVFDVSVYELSARFDIRPLVIQTLLTYLELLGVLESTGPLFNEYRFAPQRSSQEILVQFDPLRADFLRRIFRCASRGRTWYTLKLDEVIEATGEPRARIVAALNHLESQGHLALEVSGARHGYRLKRGVVDLVQLAQSLAQRFARREQHDIQRVAQVVGLTRHNGCLTAYLARYFDQQQPDCGHCGWCLGEHVPAGDRQSALDLNPDDMVLIASVAQQNHAALAHPRQLARFLCGLSSPATRSAKLTNDPAFGALSHLPFQRVLHAIASPPGAARR
jgi:ATP-dependent DNA helicase RecQ